MKPLLARAAAWLLVCAVPPAFAGEPSAATAATDAPSSWKDIDAISGELAHARAVARFALTAPPPSLRTTIEEMSAALPPIDSGAIQRSPTEQSTRRRTLFSLDVLAQGLAERAPADAFEMVTQKRGAASPWLAQRIFLAVAGVDPSLALKAIDAPSLATMKDELSGVVIYHLAEANPADALKRLDLLAEDARPHARVRCLERWLSRDAPAALEWIVRETPEDNHPDIVTDIAPFLSDTTFAELAKLAEAPVESDRRALAQALVSAALPAQSAATRRDYYGARPSLSIPPDDLPDLLAEAVSKPGESSASFVASLAGRIAPQVDSVRQLAEAWAQLDPERSLSWAGALPDPALREAGLLRVCTMLYETRSEAVFATIESLGPGPLRSAAVSNLAKAMSITDSPRALRWVASLPPGPDQTAAMRGVVHFAGDFDPARLAPVLASLPSSSAVIASTEFFVKRWTNYDAAAASAWYRSLPDDQRREKALHALIGEIRGHAPDLLHELASSLPRPDERAAAIISASKSAAPDDLDRLLPLIETLPPGRKRQLAESAIFGRLADTDPAGTASLVSSGALGPVEPAVFSMIADKYIYEDPEGGARWLVSLLGGERGAQAAALLGKHARRLGEQRLTEAVPLLASLPAGSLRRKAHINLFAGMAGRYPDLAWRLARAELGHENLSPTAQAMAMRQPGATRARIADSDLPDHTKEFLLKKLDLR